MTKPLMVIDVQKWGFTGEWQVADSSALLARIRERIKLEREKTKNLIIHVQNDAPEDQLDTPGGPFWGLMIEPIEGEWLVNKTTPDAFESNTDLAHRLRAVRVNQIEMIGCQSEMCVRSTLITARAEGFSVSLPVGLHGTYDQFGPSGDLLLTGAEISGRVQQEFDTI